MPALTSLAPLGTIGAISIAILALAALLAALILLSNRVRRTNIDIGTWDCGYAAPTSRMQYTSSSFARSIQSLFSRVLKPRFRREPVEGLFPTASMMESHVDDAVLDRVILPAFSRLEQASGWFKRFQQGLAQDYILFILITVMALLAGLLPVKEIMARIFAR